ncbi:hypothetical protein P389DRAFT_181516 [Cystobasidium minutum MCA 4210]|uniref:uncharacterized protein n=1 Tax=Cystobasidium minutum MCA 4210 TaxID=1397322 RepID=UPI0034CD0F3B|eukprot:jgi/Rhomi1/181516/fgenesh1_pg.7_\
MDPVTPRAGRAKTQDAANTPQRRSLYDLQKLIDEVFDGFASSRSGTHTHREDSAGEDPQDEEERTCRAADLPAILTAFEKRRNVMLLDENEMEMLKAFTEQHPDLDVSSEQLVSLLSAMTADSSKADPSSPTRPSQSSNDKALPTPPPSDIEDAEPQQFSSSEVSNTPSSSRSRSSSNSSSSSSSHNSTTLTGSGTLEEVITSPSLFDIDPIFPRSKSMPDGVLLQQVIPSPPGTPVAPTGASSSKLKNIHQRSHTSGDLASKASGHGDGMASHTSGIPRPISSNVHQYARAKSSNGAIVQISTPLSAAIASSRQRSSPLVDIQGEHALRRSRPAPPKSRRISSGGMNGNSNSNVPASSSTGSISDLLDSAGGRRSRQHSHDEMVMLTSNTGVVSPRMMMMRSPSPVDGATSPLFSASLDAMHEEDPAGDSSFDDVYTTRSASRPGGGRSRQASSYSNRGASPLFDTSPPPQSLAQGAMFPPQSPLLDDTSFHTIPISPHELNQPMDDLSSDLDNVNDDEVHIIHTRPVSTISTTRSLSNNNAQQEISALQEMIQSLQQELQRKNKIIEASKNDTYMNLMEKESQLEEVKLELSAKRKEEKELRGKEKINLNQIATLEAQTAAFRDERDKIKIAHQTARKQYEEQCSESEKLRNVIRSRDEDLQLAEENLQNVNSDLAKVTRERDYLQSRIATLETELAEAKLALEQLEEARSENIQLKETIDRLRLDLDELRAQARINAENNANKKAGGAALSRSASGTESVPVTLSRNLGRELARRFAGDDGNEELDEKDEQKDGQEDYEEEEIITTRRRLKRPMATKKSESTSTGPDQTNATGQEFLSLEVCDVQIQVSPPEILTSDQFTQTEKERELSAQEKRLALARELCVDLDAVEEYVRAKEERARLAAAVSTRHGVFQPYTTVLSREARSVLGYALESSGSLLAYTLIVFLSGLLTGSTALAPVRHHHHIASVDSYAHWAAYNTLDLGQVGHGGGWKENAWFVIEKIIWKGVAISRRVPT